MLPPNSTLKVKKVDHANQIVECDYVLPEKPSYTPDEAYDMKISESSMGKFDRTSTQMDDKWRYTETTTIDYPNRKIKTVDNGRGNSTETLTKTDITKNPDGTTTEVFTTDDAKTGRQVTKVVKDENGKIIFKNTIK